MRAAVGVGLPLALCALLLPAGANAEQADRGDRRGRELLSYACSSELARDELTLFANGTVRLRHERLADAGSAAPLLVAEDDGRGARGDEAERLDLVELTPDELDGYRARLAEIDLAEAESVRSGPVGEWVEQCTLALTLDGRAPHRFRFGRYDSLGLALSRVRGIAAELWALTERRAGGEGLPVDYQPRPGDLLVRSDGERYEVVGYTWDGAGLELRGVDQPILLFIPAASLSLEFDTLLERREP